MSPKAKADLKLESIQPITLAEVPGRNYGGVLTQLAELRDLEAIAKSVKENGATPYEAWDVLDIERLRKSNPEAAKMKTLLQGFLLKGRKVLAKYQVNKKLKLIARSNKLFLVSTEE
jgi:hypothetical protein